MILQSLRFLPINILVRQLPCLHQGRFLNSQYLLLSLCFTKMKRGLGGKEKTQTSFVRRSKEFLNCFLPEDWRAIMGLEKFGEKEKDLLNVFFLRSWFLSNFHFPFLPLHWREVMEYNWPIVFQLEKWGLNGFLYSLRFLVDFSTTSNQVFWHWFEWDCLSCLNR